MKSRRRVDVNLDELDRVLDGARQAPLSEADHDKVKGALHALAAMIAPRTTEKTSVVLEKTEGSETGAGAQPDSIEAELNACARNRARRLGGRKWARVVRETHVYSIAPPRCANPPASELSGKTQAKLLDDRKPDPRGVSPAADLAREMLRECHG